MNKLIPVMATAALAVEHYEGIENDWIDDEATAAKIEKEWESGDDTAPKEA